MEITIFYYTNPAPKTGQADRATSPISPLAVRSGYLAMMSVRSQFGLGFHPFLRNSNNRELSHAPRRVALCLLCVPAAHAISRLLGHPRLLPPSPDARSTWHHSHLRLSVGACPSLQQLRGAPAGAMRPYVIRLMEAPQPRANGPRKAQGGPPSTSSAP